MDKKKELTKILVKAKDWKSASIESRKKKAKKIKKKLKKIKDSEA